MPPADEHLTDEPRAETRRKLSREERRRQLIEATVTTLARSGYAGTTMGEVAKTAGLSHGLVNFHFETKEKLLAATLDYLAEEYRSNWSEALANAPQATHRKIAAMLAADFKPEICTPDRLSAWCSFWGEAQCKPMYREHCGSNDSFYIDTLEGLCRAMNDQHGYAVLPSRAARLLRVSVEGVWLDMMTMSSSYSVEEALATVWTGAAAIYPRHFTPEGAVA